MFTVEIRREDDSKAYSKAFYLDRIEDNDLQAFENACKILFKKEKVW